MNYTEFKNWIKKRNCWKTIKFVIWGILIIFLGLVLSYATYFKVFKSSPSDLTNYITSLCIIIIGYLIINSTLNKLKIISIRNNKSIDENNKIIDKIINEPHFYLAENSEKIFHVFYQRKRLTLTYEIHIVINNKEVLLNVNCPGSKEHGILSFGYGKKMRTRIINEFSK